MPGGADFVLHFWDEAAARLLRKPVKGQINPLRRFGFITTNSITQTFWLLTIAANNYLVRYSSMASQASSASASLLKGEPPILMAPVF